jgi:4-alpha-glucanotransferase
MAMKRRMQALEKASRAFFESGNTELQERYKTFCGHESTWLDDYALFQSLDDMSGHVNWTSWDGGYVFRNPSALNKVKRELSVRIEHHKFLQWRFHEQWEFLKKYANAKGIRLIGDIPIFVAHHSADVWANQKYFFLGKDRRPDFVAGVPPDYFSETGQRWGNPLYKWDAMEKDRYGWWVERFRKAFRMFDIARIDHFRGFVSFWEIPASEEKAVNGTWKKGPGLDFFRSVQRRMGRMNIIAEDLGMITADVHELRRKLTYPGMKVLQFAFSGDPGNDYLPHNYEQNCVVYTGTHDNDTVKGWYEKITDREKYLVKRYCRNGEEEINWALIELAMRSSADIAVFPFQDVLGLGSEGRMNYPGKIKGNWEWRFRWEQVGPGPAEKLAELSDAYNRRNK